MSTSLTSTEEEVTYLVAVIESIDSMVNGIIFEPVSYTHLTLPTSDLV